MYLKTMDGKVIFATHFVQVALTEELRKLLHAFQREPNGVICYSAEEAQAAESLLQNAKATYTVQPQTVDPTLVTKSTGIVYASRSEALNHLMNNGEVESLRLPNMQADIDLIKKKLNL